MSIPGLQSGTDPSGTTFGTQFTREAPQIEARKLQLMDTASGFAKNPVSIPGQQVSDFTNLQNEAFTRTQQGLGKFQPYLNSATQQLLGSTAAYDPTTAYKQYMNPYQDEVISGIERQFDKMESQANLSAAQSGAFGGSRQGIQTAELGQQRAQAVGQAQAQNYQQAQQQAQDQFSNQMQRQQTAAQGLGLGTQQQALQQGDIASAMSAGSVQQQRLQQVSDAQYRQNLQQLYEPYQRLGFVSDIYQGMPSSGMSTTMGTSPMTNPLAQAVGTGITGLAGYQALTQGS